MGNALEIYKNVTDPVAYSTNEKQIKAVSVFVGCSVDAAPAVIMTCMCEGITLLDYIRNYHTIGGKPTKQTQAAVADFISNYGGQQKIVEVGPEKSVVEFTDKNGHTTTWTLTLDEAREAGWPLKADGKYKDNWDAPVKRADMLYYRNVSRALKKICPAIFGGLPTTEEYIDLAEVVPAATNINGATGSTPPAKKASVDELLAAASTAPAAVASIVPSPAVAAGSDDTAGAPYDADVSDAEYEVVSAGGGGDTASTGNVSKIIALAEQAWPDEAERKSSIEAIIAKRGVTAISLLSNEQAKEIIDRLESLLKNR